MSNVIKLEFQSPHVEPDTMAFISCRVCKNKTFTLTEDRIGDFRYYGANATTADRHADRAPSAFVSPLI